MNNDPVGLGERRRYVYFCRRRRFLEPGVNLLRQLEIRFENENTAAWGGFVGGMARRRFVHEFKKGGGAARVSFAGHALMDRCLLPKKWKAVFIMETA